MREVTRAALEEELSVKVKAREPKKTEEELTKQVELTWAITGNDLSYRVARIENFLKEGRRVEVVIAPKKGGRKATSDEVRELLKYIRERLKETEGTEEWKGLEGVPGAQVTMFYQNKGMKAVVSEEKRARKEEERQEKLEEKTKAGKLEKRAERMKKKEMRRLEGMAQ